MNQIIASYKAIYKIFGSGIYTKPRYILKPKQHENHNNETFIFSVNDTRISGYLWAYINIFTSEIFLLYTTSSAEFKIMDLTSKKFKVVSYI